MPPNDLFLALDLGSSSVRASLYTCAGERLEGLSVQRAVEQQPDGAMSVLLARERTEEAIDECLERFRSARVEGKIGAVAWASFAMSWLGVDPRGTAVTPVYSYADRRSGAYARELQEELRRKGRLEATRQRTGTPIHSAYAPAQLLRLANEEPERLQAIAGWQTLAAHLLARWRGEAVSPISSSEAGWTGLYNRYTHTWDAELMARLPLTGDHLPPVHDYTATRVGLAPEQAYRWPELATTPFFLAVGDGVAANIGSGCTDNRHIALTIGTTGALRVVAPTTVEAPTPRVPSGLWCYPVDSRRWLLGGALTDGGSLYAWLRETLHIEDDTGLQAEAAALPPDGHGLTVLPFLRGERSPGWATDATLTITGITPATTPPHLVRAVMEAVALRLRLIHEGLAPFIHPQSQIIASGGALHAAPLWRQILADVLQKPVHLIDSAEATSRGAVILARQALGGDELPLPPIVHTALPDPDCEAIYRRAAERQAALYRKVLASKQDAPE